MRSTGEIVRSLLAKADDEEFREGLRQMGRAAERARRTIERRLKRRQSTDDGGEDG